MSAPSNPPAQKLLELAARAMGAGRFDEAEAQLRRVLVHDPENATALHHLALRAWLKGQTKDARHLLERAALAAPDDAAVLTSYGTMLHEMSEPRAALDVFLRILALDSAQPEIWNAAGICFQETGRAASAIEFYLRALTLRPAFAEAYSNLGAVLTHEGDLDGAVTQLREALRLDPALADGHHNLGIALRARFEYAAAIASLREALRLQPDHAEMLSSLGEVLSLVGEEEAVALLRRAVALRPDDPEKHWNLALALLKRGDYAEGWREYEWRWRRPQNERPLRPFAQPFWRGEPVQNKTVLLYAEQGFGDTLQFLRYVPRVLALGARVVLEVQRPLLGLTEAFARTLPKPVTVVAQDDPLPAFDWHVPLMSLPAAFSTTVETVPEPQRLTPLAPPRPPSRPLRIGLAWAGNPKHLRDRERSIPAEALLPLFAIPGCAWVSLQTGPAAAQLAGLGVAIEQPPLADFLDTAAVIDTLDLVVSVDTVVAHLAASQGAPTWVLLPFAGEWRWLLPGWRNTDGSQNPWYQRARLFRQHELPDGRPQAALWQPVIAEVAATLAALVVERAADPARAALP
jgi:tetratricopeptide (TPR) repeat protein